MTKQQQERQIRHDGSEHEIGRQCMCANALVVEGHSTRKSLSERQVVPTRQFDREVDRLINVVNVALWSMLSPFD